MLIRIILLILSVVIGLVSGGFLSGCSLSGPEILDVNIQEQEIPLAQIIPASALSSFDIPMPSAPGLLTENNDQAFIDYSNKHFGYVTAGFLEDTDNIVKIMIIAPGGREYIYSLIPGISEVFPLTDGDGRYIISIHEHVTGNIYRDILAVTIDVKLYDEFAPFIRPNQYVNYCNENRVTAKAAELKAESLTRIELIEAIYNFVTKNISYDFELADTLDEGYRPDLNLVLERGQGICFDIAALTTAMLRSQGIPAKLVFGYYYDSDNGTIYHAWVSVFSEEEGKIGDHISITAGTWNILDPTLATIMSMSEPGVTARDGKVYHALYYY